MGPIVHVGFTVALLSGAKLAGYSVGPEIVAASIIGGVFLDADKALEIMSNRVRAKKHIIPDITARCRILHSTFAFPFGLALSYITSSFLPFIAVLSHIFLDSFIPGLIKDGKNYPSLPPFKWIAVPFIKKWWSIVTIGWPITYPPEFNWIYVKLCPAIGFILLLMSALYWLLLYL